MKDMIDLFSKVFKQSFIPSAIFNQQGYIITMNQKFINHFEMENQKILSEVNLFKNFGLNEDVIHKIKEGKFYKHKNEILIPEKSSNEKKLGSTYITPLHMNNKIEGFLYQIVSYSVGI